MVDVAQTLSFSLRPPTPPKENDDDPNKTADHCFYVGPLGQNRLLDTPEVSPSSSVELFGGSNVKNPKRVVFSPYTKSHEPLSISTPTALAGGHIKQLPPSRQCTAVNKSILKASVDPRTLFDLPGPLIIDPNDSLAIMLRSVTQHLASSSRDSRLDSYMTLLGCLSAYEEVPDTKTLVESLTCLTESIRRDISATVSKTGAMDSQLATHALKVLTALLQTPGLVDAVPDEFCMFVVDRAISSIENQDTPKIIMEHFLYLVARQNISGKIMNTDRANRVLAALVSIDGRIKSNRIVGSKLMIYQRLLTLAKPSMISRAEDWLECLITSLLSPTKDIRARAIAFGVDAGLCLGTFNSVSQTFMELLDKDVPTDTRVIHGLGTHMLSLLTTKDSSLQVPQMWALPILFFRAKPHQLERWEHFKGWVSIMQRCFNSSDAKTKVQANLSWSRLVFATCPDASCNTKLIRMLRQPILIQLHRKLNDRTSKQSRYVARSTYCNLLYYAFRPGSSFTQLDFYWDECVVSGIHDQPKGLRSGVQFASETIAALLSSPHHKLWDENRANRVTPMSPDELPCLDPKWVRLNAAKVLTVFSGLLERSGWQNIDSDSNNTLLVWSSFITALGEAASKEVKVSIETMTAVAHILSFIKRFLQNQNEKGDGGDADPIHTAMILIQKAVTKLGLLPFIEKRLTLGPSGDLFEATETPSSRKGRHIGSLNSPIAHILQFLISTVQSDRVTDEYRIAVDELVHTALRGSTSRTTQMSILRELSQLSVPSDTSCMQRRLFLWQQIAVHAEMILSSSKGAEPRSDTRSPSQELKDAIRILESGLHQSSDEAFPLWQQLLAGVSEELRLECGDGCVLLIVIEPLAEAINRLALQSCNALLVRCGTCILAACRWPESRQIMDRARKQLSGPYSISVKNNPIDPFDSIYSMIDNLSAFSYSHFKSFPTNLSTELLSAMASFILSCPTSLKGIMLKKVQGKIAVWIEDPKGLLTSSTISTELREVFQAVKGLWKVIIAAIKTLPKMDTLTLASIQIFVSAGLNSKHRAIANESIITWNETFGKAQVLGYPSTVQAALARLRLITDIELPNFPEKDAIEVTPSPIYLVESQQDAELSQGSFNLPVHRMNTAPNAQEEPTPSRVQMNSKQSPQPASYSPPCKASPRTMRSTPKSRRRHDDSQIHFAAIESSPIENANLEPQQITEHQQQVRERQQQDAAAMFPRIGPSPQVKHWDLLPELMLSGRRSSTIAVDADGEISPMFPPDDLTMTDVLGSSPTPRSSRRGSLDRRSEHSSYESAIPIRPSSSFADSDKVPLDNKVTTRDSPISQKDRLGEKGSWDVQTGIDVAKSIDRDGRSIPFAARFVNKVDDLNTYLPSESDVFADAPSVPRQEKVDEEKDSMRIHQSVSSQKEGRRSSADASLINVVEESAQSLASENSSNPLSRQNGSRDTSTVEDSYVERLGIPPDDEQVEAQLFRDLEQASSQGDSQTKKQSVNTKSPGERVRKRRGSFLSQNEPQKKPRVSTSQKFEVVVETRKSGATDDDCILVDARPATSDLLNPSRVSPVARLEKSASSGNPVQRPRKTVVDAAPVRSTRSMSARQPSPSNYCSTPVSTDNVPFSHENLPASKKKTPRTKSFNTGTVHHSEDSFDNDAMEDDQPFSQAVREVRSNPAVSLDCDAGPTSSQIEEVKAFALRLDTEPVARSPRDDDMERPHSLVSEGDTIPDSPMEEEEEEGTKAQVARLQEPGSRLGTDPPTLTRAAPWPTVSGVLGGFRNLLNHVKSMRLRPEEQREMTEMAFELIREAQDAGRRNSG